MYSHAMATTRAYPTSALPLPFVGYELVDCKATLWQIHLKAIRMTLKTANLSASFRENIATVIAALIIT